MTPFAVCDWLKDHGIKLTAINRLVGINVGTCGEVK
jgi:hypothetical protein